MKPKDFMPLNDAAERLGVTPGRLRQLCGQGRVPGATKFAGAWFLPKPLRILQGGRGDAVPTKIRMVKSA
jgi:hypothetical protein